MSDVGKKLVARERFRVNSVELDYEPPAGSSNEFWLYIDNINIHHYLFKDVQRKFLVENPTGWVMHPICFLDPKNSFSVLAESSFTPEIIEQGLRIGCLFYIGKKYPETFCILRNFMFNMLYKLKYGGHKHKSILV